MKVELRGTETIRPYEQNPRVNDQAVEAKGKSPRTFEFQGVVIQAAERYPCSPPPCHHVPHPDRILRHDTELCPSGTGNDLVPSYPLDCSQSLKSSTSLRTELITKAMTAASST